MRKGITFINANFQKILIVLILVLGFAVRIYNLTGVPFGFHGDEAAIGYNAYTILTKGTDEYGVPFPMFFKSFGEYKSAVQIYSTVPFILVWGLNEFSTRFVSVFYAMLSLIAVYFFTLELFKTDKQKKTIALLTLFFLAISPWHIQFSRVAYEIMPFLFFTILGLYFFLKAQKRPTFLPFVIISFAFALYSYFTGRLFIPVLGVSLFIIYFRFFHTHKKQTFISLIILLILLIPFIQSLFTQVSVIRWQQSSLFYHPPRNESLFQAIETNYFEHFSPSFLFFTGNNTLPNNPILRDAVNGMGELYLFQLPLILLGVYVLFKRKNKMKDNAFKILLLLFILYPLGGMFASDGSPFARRSVIGVIPFQIISALGSVFFLEAVMKMKKVTAALIFCGTSVIIIVSFLYYLNLYFIAYPKYSSSWWGWQYGPKDIVAYFTSHENQYDDMFMPYLFNGPHEFFKFYAPGDCAKCQIGLPDNYYNSARRQLYALPPNYFVSHPMYTYKRLKTLYYPDGSVAFVLSEVKEK
jgi:4-amino-4-deoxy-L-arabinose transferase-like glycosyltransferase